MLLRNDSVLEKTKFSSRCDTSKKNITPPYPTKIVHLKILPARV